MSIIIEIAISLIAVFLLLSLATTAVNEAIASLLKTRARHLSVALDALLKDPKVRDAFYDHPLIMTYRRQASTAETGVLGWYLKGWRHPSYVPSKSFAKALHKAILDAQEQDEATPAEQSVSGFRMAAAKIEDETLRTAVLALVDGASESLEDTRKAFADWFDVAMDQLTGQFKRRQQLISFLVALGIAAGLNMNLFTLTTDLIENSARRLAFVEFGESQLDLPDLGPFFEVDEAELGSSVPIVPGLDPQASSTINPFEALTDFGFGHKNFELETLMYAASDPRNWLSWFLAALATILGAPFWFDLLKRFVNVRGSGVRPPKDSN